jgi:hypothetical protein
VTIPEPDIPSPWDDRTTQDDPAMTEFLDQINSQDQEDDEEVETLDPTTTPVNSILIICSGYITNILIG